MTTVAIVDDHAVFRAGLRNLLSREPGLDVVAEAGDAQAAYQAIEAARPEVVTLDLALPDVNGIAVGREVARRAPRTKMLALSIYADAEHVVQAFDAGVLGYAIKAQPADQLLAAVRTVAEGRRYLAPSFSPVLVGDAQAQRKSEAPISPLRSLTRREREIFDLTVRGLSNAAIASKLGISRRTVETHRSRILRKVRAHNALDLVRLAALLGILES
jgi:DNA-binding NarL/FixJ family response regulator